MKNGIKIIAGLSLALVNTSVIAQKVKGERVLTVGASIAFEPSKGLNATYDYAIFDKLSLGLGANYTLYPLYGSLNRSNFGGRALYHLGNKPNWDFYGGLRIGGSSWAGSGSVTNDILRFTRSGGRVSPSVQAVVGLRYMALGWLGVNAEAGFGAPYIYSMGLNVNLGNTSKAITTIKDAYNSEILPAEKKNILKVNLTSLVAIPGISYERYLTNRFSVEFGANYRFFNSPQTLSVNEETGVLSENDSVSKGVKGYGLVKFYITSKHNPFPKGWYLGAGGSYFNRTTIIKVVDLHPIKNPVVFDYEKKTEQYGGDIVIGYQRPFAKHFTLDVFGGIRFGEAKLKSFRYLNSQANEENFVSYFGGHQNPIKPQFESFILKVSIGYLF